MSCIGIKRMYDPRKDRTVKRTFSIFQDVLYGLEKESVARVSNPSALLNQILRRWLSFDSPLDKIGIVMFTDACLEAMISKMDMDMLREIARDQATRSFGAL
ncbi:MAG: hypothetical protein KGI33_12735, partial [Thaumarchaeota archaeon]|nr:hypothetical protein [Nitrososphaerota archaeon]